MEWIDALERGTARFADVLASGDLAAEVPTCPGWTLADLGEHVRWVHRWAAHAVTAGTPDGDTVGPGPEREALVAGYRAAAADLVALLRDTDPDAPAWTFGPDKVAGFWHRRQVHEVALHLYDALASQDATGDWDVDPALAWDGVAEVVTVFYPRQVRLGRSDPLSAPVRLRADDLANHETMLATDVVAPEVLLEGTAADVLLTLWGRRRADGEVAAVLERARVTP